jgi:hypothetical protein
MTSPANSAATRRAVLVGAGLAGLVHTRASAAPLAPRSPALDLTTPPGRLKAYMQMRGALDDRLVIGFVSGRYYGVIDSEMTPLYGVVGATFARYRPRADGGYDAATYEIAYFTDLETGAALNKWANPYTGEIVDVPETASPPSTLVITPDLHIDLAKSFPGMTDDDRVVSSQVAAPDVWITEETKAAMVAPGAAKPFHYGEIVTLHADLSAFASSDTPRVPCQTAYTSVVSWRPWLKMGTRSGHLLGNGSGRYGATLDQLPPAWLEAVSQRRPGVLKDPGAPLKQAWGV